MCSIFGFNTSIDEHDIGKILQSMRHRGPDGEGFVILDEWTLGHQRLSVIDTTDAGKQPMSIDDSTIVFNGEIYNYKELHADFLGHEFLSSSSDTEVLLHCLDKYGLSFLHKLNGMFAFAWYNHKTKILYLCRDRFGVKPLHWAEIDGGIFFASEIQPIAAQKKPLSLNQTVVDSFLVDTATDFNEETFLDGIYQIPPGHYLEVGSDGARKMVKWYLGNDYQIDESIFESEKSIIDHYEYLLRDSIKIRLRSDVPVCITLSGGLDSSIIYAIAKQDLGANIHPFHFMHPGALTDESEKVSKMMARYGDYFCAIQAEEDFTVEGLEHALDVLEFPVWNPSALAYIQTYETIRKSGFVVVMEGHGSDEQLGGYPYMVSAAFNDCIKGLRLKQACLIFRVAHLTTNIGLGQRRSIFRLVFSFAKGIIGACKPNSSTFREVVDRAFSYKILPIVLRVFDRLTMANSLESRSPFMDFRLVEFSRRLPLNLMVSEMGNKTILRKLLERKKLDFIYKDKVKMGFASDLPKFFNSQKIRKYFVNEMEGVKLAGAQENLRIAALKKILSGEIGWKDFDLVWKGYAMSWVAKKYLLDNKAKNVQ